MLLCWDVLLCVLPKEEELMTPPLAAASCASQHLIWLILPAAGCWPATEEHKELTEWQSCPVATADADADAATAAAHNAASALGTTTA